MHGQQAFCHAVLERLHENHGDVVAAFSAPDKEGRSRDPLAELAEAKGLPLHRPASWETPETEELIARDQPDACMMAYVALFVPQDVLELPAKGAFHHHPSLCRAIVGPPAA